MSIQDFKFEVDINVINHLGVGLYSSTPAALAELVANSWDAEARNVDITIEPGDKSVITIRDDGHGMGDKEVRERFLRVGFSRRGEDGLKNKTANELRYVMGRKGIGKLAMLALSEKVVISTQKLGEKPIRFEIFVEKFKEEIQRTKKSILKGKEIDEGYFPKGHGTEIKLINTHASLNTTETYLRKRLARRFSVKAPPPDKFNITVNNAPISVEDREYYSKIKYLWAYDSDTEELIKNVADLDTFIDSSKECVKRLDSSIEFEGKKFNITGFIASVRKPKHLGAKEDSANMISIFANGKVFTEDILSTELSNAKFFSNYLTGEIHADFLDRDGVDRATANREAIKKQDPLYKKLITKLLAQMTSISEDWDEWRRKTPFDENDPETKAIQEWIDTLEDPRDKDNAHKIMRAVQTSSVSDDPIEERIMKKTLYQNIVVGFHSLEFRKELAKLCDITDVMSPEFQKLFLSLDQLEQVAYAQITKERIVVIEKFRDIIKDPKSLEKVAQKYLFDNLWLLEPTWDRISASTIEMEKTITKHLKDRKYLVDGDSRLDLAYRRSSGQHVIVELKRPSRRMTVIEIKEQIRKYSMGFEEYYRQHNDPLPGYVIYMLIGEKPTDWDDEKDAESLRPYHAKIVTYQYLLDSALATYQQYLTAKEEIVSNKEKIIAMFD